MQSAGDAESERRVARRVCPDHWLTDSVVEREANSRVIDQTAIRILGMRGPRMPTAQNIPLSFSALSGTTCSTSQCSTILPALSNRKMSIPA